MRFRLLLLPTLFVGLSARVCAQQTPVRVGSDADPAAEPAIAPAAEGVWRLEGRDPSSGIRYVRVFTFSQAPDAAAAPVPKPEAPTLTGQCTQEPNGKLHFELFVNFGGVPDLRFYPPWRSTGPDDLFPPATHKVTLTMEFLGYTKVKPFRRQFEEVTAPGPGQLRYMNPGGASSNMEPPGYFFQYLRALPTLRLSGNGHVAEFATSGWLAQLHKEPLCAGSGA